MAETSEMNVISKALDEKSLNNPIRQENKKDRDYH